jgi:hypothetical protein
LRLSAFLREPFKHIKIQPSGQTGQGDSCSNARAAQNIKQLPAQNAPEPLGLTGVSSWVLQ